MLIHALEVLCNEPWCCIFCCQFDMQFSYATHLAHPVLCRPTHFNIFGYASGAMCSHVNCLDPPILLPDYWLICPTCVFLVTSFAPFIISLCLQSCASSSSHVSCPALSCPVLPCQACQLSCFSPTG